MELMSILGLEFSDGFSGSDCTVWLLGGVVPNGSSSTRSSSFSAASQKRPIYPLEPCPSANAELDMLAQARVLGAATEERNMSSENCANLCPCALVGESTELMSGESVVVNSSIGGFRLDV